MGGEWGRSGGGGLVEHVRGGQVWAGRGEWGPECWVVGGGLVEQRGIALAWRMIGARGRADLGWLGRVGGAGFSFGGAGLGWLSILGVGAWRVFFGGAGWSGSGVGRLRRAWGARLAGALGPREIDEEQLPRRPLVTFETTGPHGEGLKKIHAGLISFNAKNNGMGVQPIYGKYDWGRINFRIL